MILELALTVAILAPARDEVSDARAALAAAIDAGEAAEGSEAAQKLGKSPTRAATEALVKGLEQTLKAAARLEGEIAKLQDSVDDDKKDAKARADYRVNIQSVSEKLADVHSIRGAVARALSAARGEEATGELLRRLRGKDDGLLRSYVAEALRANDHADVLPALLERISNEDDARVKVSLLDALAAKKPRDAGAVAKIAALLKDSAWQVVVGAANALAAIKAPEAIDPLIDGLRKAEGRVKADFNAALAAITGVDKHGDAAVWREWFDRNREAVVTGKYQPEPAEKPRSDQGGGTTFYGLPVTSRNMVFVIDASMSMKHPSQWKPDLGEKKLPGDVVLGGDLKIDVAKYELKKVLAMLPDGAEFNIVFFHRDVDVFSPVMVKLNKEVRPKAFAWIDGLQLVLMTNIYEGVKRGFSFGGSGPAEKASPRATVIKGADTMYLLSDGQPTTGIKDTNEFCRAVAELNRVQKMTIHTVAIEPTPGSGRFLQRVAQENGGQYAARGGKAPKKQTMILRWAALAILLAAQVDPELPVREGLELRFEPGGIVAADGRVGVWKDASGQGRHLRAGEASRPLRHVLGPAVARFDGRDDVLSAGGLGLSVRDFTLVLVAAPHSSAGHYRCLASGNAVGKNDYQTGFNLDLGARGHDDWSWLNAEGAGFTGERNLLTGAAPMATFHVVALTSAPGPGGTKVHFDGAPRGARDRAESRIALDDFRLGARRYSNTDAPPSDQGFFHGDIAEVLVYGRALPEEERRSVESWLRKRHEPLFRPGFVAAVPPAPVNVLVPGFTVKPLPVRLTNLNSLEYAADGRLFALGYDGRLHVLVDSDGDGLEDRVKPFWYRGEGDLRGPIGMAVAKEGVYVASKGKVSLVRDTDGDGEGDACETVATGWQEIPQNVDAVGVALDPQGNLYFGLGCANFANPYLVDKEGRPRYDIRSERGTILKVSPDRKRREIVCTGVRFPVALAFNRHGDLFATDQEGETWCPNGNPLDELLHILPGRHYGFPPRHPQHFPNSVDEPPVVAFGPQHQSTCGLKFNEAGPGRKSFGPAAWEGDALVAGESRGKIWRVPLVKTKAGYVGKPIVIATLRMLTVDLAVSPAGDLVVCCHSGPPDWGTGPKGEGRLFKIVYSDREAPQPAAVWPSGPLEVKVAFDRPVDPAALKEAKIVYGEYVAAGDRFEVLTPPYKVVEEQKRSPRRELPVVGMKLSDDRRTLTLSTAPHPWRATYALTLSKVGGQEVDLEYEFTGVEAEGAWLPHLDPEVCRAFLKGSAEHERHFEGKGGLALRTRLSLPGGEATLSIAGELVRVNGVAAETVKLSLGTEPMHLVITAGGGELRASYTTDVNPNPRPVALEQLLLPWAPLARPTRPAPEESGTTAGGDWTRGKAIFIGEGKCASCHAVRGEGGRNAPDLTNLVSWAPARVLREIVEPNAALNPDYVNHIVKLRDGRLLTGVVLTEGADRIRIVDGEAKETIVARGEIAELRPSAISIMPDTYKSLGESKLRDLVTFLTSEPGDKK